MQWMPIWFGLAGLLAAGWMHWLVLRHPPGTADIIRLGERIHHGAMVFMRQEYRLLLIFTLIVALLLHFSLGWRVAVACLTGAGCSALAGWLGMYTATRANARTTAAAQDAGAPVALRVAFQGGAVMGLAVAALGLLGLGALFLLFAEHDPAQLQGFGLGASSVALFSRVGGGIFTKSADVAADLVGKVEQDIPEDDPRNPAVIADNVGDNVGDVVGMGSDMFESYCGAIIASITLAASLPIVALQAIGPRAPLILLPLLLPCLGLLSSLIGMATVALLNRYNPELALRSGMLTAAALFIGLAWPLIAGLGIAPEVWIAVLFGTLGGVLIGLATEYSTAGPPVRRIAEAGRTGPATLIITGLSVGMYSVALPLIAMTAIILIANQLAGLYGIGLAAVGLLATVAMIMAVDAFGPIADNAGGIAEMAGLGDDTRRITDALDATGNTTAAIGKGFAIGAAALSSVALISAYVQAVRLQQPEFSLDLANPEVLGGIFLGGIVPVVIAGLCLTAVGEAAAEIMREIRRQFEDIEGLLAGRAEPDTDRCIAIASRAALRHMVLPVALSLLTPALIGLFIGPAALGGMLAGALLGCVLLALLMSNAGGAWDNAKKYVEAGHLGGKGSDVHKASVVGDTVGDPFKDTAGPAMNILIKLMAIVSLVLAPLLV